MWAGVTNWASLQYMILAQYTDRIFPCLASKAVTRWKASHLDLWDEALKAVYQAQRTPWGKKEFENLLKDFNLLKQSGRPTEIICTCSITASSFSM
jgi:hypothetical protein